MRMRMAALAVGLCSGPAAPAAAAELTLSTECSGNKGCAPVLTIVEYDAAAGEANDLTVGHDGRRFTFRDRVAIAAPSRCQRLSDREVACAGARAQVRLGDGADLVRATTELRYPLSIDAGPGDDRLDGTGASLQGGEGDDDLTGRILAGGPGRDSLTATVDDHATLVGGADADVLRGGDGDDVLAGDVGDPHAFESAPPAPDVLDGGRGADVLSYLGHAVPVRVDLSTQTGGSAGEGDVVTGFEHAQGGNAGDDVLETYEASTLDGGDGDDVVDGGWEDDVLEGGAGADTLSGGFGVDRYSGGDGDDRLEVSVAAARGLRRERVWCGGGADEVDWPDLALVQRDCELVNSLPAYPRALAGPRLAFAIPRAGRFRGGRLELRLRDARRPFATRRLTRRRGTAHVRLRVPRRIRRLSRTPLPVEVRVYGREYLERAWVIDLPR
jgi:hemolysin type calcium-binding protein